MSHLRTASKVLLVVLASCAKATPGAQPHDMSVASHETTAAQEELVASEHGRRYDPSAEQRRERCLRGRAAAMVDGDPCWTSVTR